MSLTRQPRGPAAPRHPPDRLLQQEDGLPLHPHRGRRGRDRLPGRLRGRRLHLGQPAPRPARRAAAAREARTALLRQRIELGARAAHPPARGRSSASASPRSRPRIVGARDITRRDAARTASTPRSCCWTWPGAWTRTGATRRPRSRRRSPEPAADDGDRRAELARPRPDADGRARAAAAAPSGAAARPAAPPPRPRRRAARAAAAPRRAPAGRAAPILLVDDEEDVRRILAEHFTRGGYQVRGGGGPRRAVKKARPAGQGRHRRSCSSPTSACRPRAAPRSRAASRS